MTEDDLAEVIALEGEVFGDPWSEAAFRAELQDAPRLRWPLVARVGGALVGYLVAWFVADEAQISNLAVAPRWRRRGLGRRLLAAALREGCRRGCRAVFLEVRVSNRAAHRLYQQCGFRTVGRRRGYYPDTREDALVMRRALERAPRAT